MSDPYVGEIKMFAGSFAPAGWAFCDGQLLPISENETLFQLIGTTYGGDGQETFALPGLSSRVPLHQGTHSGSGVTYIMGEAAGVETVTLSTQQIPAHSHAFLASANTASAPGPNGNVPATTNVAKKIYAASGSPASAMIANSIGGSGGSQPHENMQPFLVVSFIISLFGIYPSQN